MNTEKINILEKALVLTKAACLIILYMAITPLITNIFLLTPLKNSKAGQNIALIVGDALIVLALILIFHKRILTDFKKFKKDYKKYLKLAFHYWFLGFIIMCVSNIIINIFITSGGLAANESANRTILQGFPLYSLVAMCFLAPISEELLFRAAFKDAFKNIIIYSLFTGLLFAGMHVATGIESWNISYLIKNYQELLYFIPYGSLGICFGYAFFKTDNIFTSISMHIFHNSLSVAMILLSFLGGA